MDKMKSVALMLLFAGSLIASAFASKSKSDPDKPNIIMVFTDDQGYQDLGSYGSPDIKTPRIDQLAREGMRFTDYYVASSVCTPSRAAFLTGCYPQRVGVRGVYFPNTGNGMNPEHVTIAEVLDSAGYTTAAVGKWHLGDLPKYLPTNQGFDSYYGIPYSNDMFPALDMKYSDDCLWRDGYSVERIMEESEMQINKWGKPQLLKSKVPLMRGEECIEFPADQTTLTKRYTEESMKFIENSVKEDKPFFLYLAHTMPHIPIFTTEEFEDKSEAGLYGDCIEEIDYTVTKESNRIEGPALFNLKEDIDESDNVIDQYPEVAERLKKALDNHLQRIQNN